MWFSSLKDEAPSRFKSSAIHFFRHEIEPHLSDAMPLLLGVCSYHSWRRRFTADGKFSQQLVTTDKKQALQAVKRCITGSLGPIYLMDLQFDLTWKLSSGVSL